jgi:methylglutamate dehydrogenase subunit A
MNDQLPASTTYAVIGAGIHGLSTAWHLAMELEARGTGSG